MTAALIKTCNNCKRPFLKEDGCNKMTCPCGNLQCYICSANISGYDHFGKSLGKCALYDDTAERQRREIAAAQGEAVQNVLQVRNDVTIADLTVDKDLLDVSNINQFITNDITTDDRGWEEINLRRRGILPAPPYQRRQVQRRRERDPKWERVQ